LIRSLREELNKKQERATQAEERVHTLERQVRILEKTLANERQKKPEPKPAEVEKRSEREKADFKTWFESWKSERRAWQRLSALICFIGESGLSQVSEMAEAFASENQLSTRTVYRLLQECVTAELLLQETGEPLDGRPPRFYTLTEKGRWLHQLLTGEVPKTPIRETMLKAHKSERHLAVILKTAELFERLGYAVDRQTPRMEIEPNRYFQPDLAARKAGETYYLEVETGEKDKPSLERKWANALAAGGRICVVTDSLNTLRRIQGGIAQWSRFERRNVKLYITCLPELKAKLPGDSPWYAVKDYTAE
jgi:hypothetical protein